VTDVCQFEYVLGLSDLSNVISKRGGGGGVGGLPASAVGREVVICFTLIMLKPRSCRLLAISSAGVLIGNCLMTAFMGFYDFA
jgi:hypothetical protein